MVTPTTARSQAHSAVPLPSGEALVRVRFCLFIRYDNSIFIRPTHFYSKVARIKASPLGRCREATVGVPMRTLFHVFITKSRSHHDFCFHLFYR